MQRHSSHPDMLLPIVQLAAATFFLGGCFTHNESAQEVGASQQQTTNLQHPVWQADRYSNRNDPAQQPRAQSCPTAESAIRIALNQILQRSGREALNRQLPLEAEIDAKGIWTVQGTLPQDAQVRASTVRIDSRNAKVLAVK